MLAIPIVVIFFISAITFLGITSLYSFCSALLIALTINFRAFWLVVVPALLVQSGFEKTVYFDRELSFNSLFDVALIPDLWLVVFFVRGLSFFFLSKENRGSLINGKAISLVFYMLFTLVFGTLVFSIVNVPLYTFNKAPLKFVLFCCLAIVVYEEIKNKNINYIQEGLLLAVILGGVFRLAFLYGDAVKDPGVYTFIGVFISVFMVVNGSGIKTRLPSSKFFWFAILFLHLSVSRTEIILFVLSLSLLIINLKNVGRNVAVSYIAVILCFPIAFFLLINFSPESVSNYFSHKVSFFSTLRDGAELGDSASVRLFTFFNLLFGETSNFINTLFGYGFFGYINFNEFYTDSIISEGAFSSEEIIGNKYYKLHFFLNNVIFYFGMLGLVVYNFVFYRFYSLSQKGLSVIVILYAYLNVFFRQELIVLFPIVLYVFSSVQKKDEC
tara:strand:- start:4276 stop:5601 length:1326 start_codon:yes stop_codon:yes gene_type:complete